MSSRAKGHCTLAELDVVACESTLQICAQGRLPPAFAIWSRYIFSDEDRFQRLGRRQKCPKSGNFLSVKIWKFIRDCNFRILYEISFVFILQEVINRYLSWRQWVLSRSLICGYIQTNWFPTSWHFIHVRCECSYLFLMFVSQDLIRYSISLSPDITIPFFGYGVFQWPEVGSFCAVTLLLV